MQQPAASQAQIREAGQGSTVQPVPAATKEPSPAPTTAATLSAKRAELDRTIWANEALAQDHEAPFVDLWDQLRSATDKNEVLRRFPFDKLLLGAPQQPQPLDNAISLIRFGPPPRQLNADQWEELLDTLSQSGYELLESEWHHARFEPAEGQRSARSMVAFKLHVINRRLAARYIVKGDLRIEWAASTSKPPRIGAIDAAQVEVLQRVGEPPFGEQLLVGPETTGNNSPRHGPVLIVYDLDRDGMSEILLPAENTLLWNRGNWRFTPDRAFTDLPKELTRGNRVPVTAGLLADVDGDGFVDFVGAGPEHVFIARGTEDGHFASSPRKVVADDALKMPSVLAAGDVDGDGDLDLWLAQYLAPYTDGQMPTPYFDANDGHPSFLLQNDGRGNFTDVTVSCGLAARRTRRTYSASLVDLDGDGDSDLVTVNDFSGIDVHRNDGSGHFTDATSDWIDERAAFGMSHTIGDYNLDGRLDLYMIGMSSTTARRLDALGLRRTEAPKHHEMRGKMGYGNRMYLGVENGFRQAPFNDQVARTGWSWGSTSFDFDNDGDTDVFVGNGHISRGTAKDYCTRYWCHDIYLGSSNPDPAVDTFVKQVISPELKSMSWNGYEHDFLLMNENGAGFRDVGFLMGVGFEFDSRHVVADDLDRDGQMDLLVVENRLESGPVLHVLRNTGAAGAHWIGTHLGRSSKGSSPLGAMVRIRTPSGGQQLRIVLAGDSYRSQHPASVHFGLGQADRVERMEVHWADGVVESIENPAIGQYHVVGQGGGGIREKRD